MINNANRLKARAEIKKLMSSVSSEETLNDILDKIQLAYINNDALSCEIKKILPDFLAMDVVRSISNVTSGDSKNVSVQSKEIIDTYFARFSDRQKEMAFVVLDDLLKRYISNEFNDCKTRPIVANTIRISNANQVLCSYRRIVEAGRFGRCKMASFNENIEQDYLIGYCKKYKKYGKTEDDMVEAKKNFDNYVADNFKPENRVINKKFQANNFIR